MRYKPLNNTKNEIRILRFVDLSSPVSTEDLIQCSIDNVSLEQRSPHLQWSQEYLKNQKCPAVWDRFTKCVDLRDTTLEQTTLDRATTIGLSRGRNQRSSFRYAWGDYEALSYTWGGGGDLKSIVVNGTPEHVTKNLEAALRALRDLQETRSDMCYWVDSLCINQEDREERNKQIKRMREIYSRARAVIVWLGQVEDTDAIAIRTMRHLCWNPCVESTLKLPKDLLVDGWPALFAFAQKPYWNRAWIIQELAVNHNSTLILCGKYKLTRRMIRLGAVYCQEFLKVTQDRSCQSGHDLEPGAWPVISRIYRLASLTSNPDVEVGLSSLLNLVRRAEATDVRDKVYGIVGLLDPAIPADITPDYSLSDQEVYTDFMISVIKNSGELDQIAYVSNHMERGWSSWVPDWRLPFGRHHIQYLRSRSASGNLSTQTRIIEQGRNGALLVCTGFQVDMVDGTAPGLPLHRSTQPRNASDRYSGRTSEALQQTLLMGHPKATTGVSVGYPRATTGLFKSGVIKDVLFKIPWSLRPSADSSSANSRPTSQWSKIIQSSYFQRFDEFRKHNQDFRIGGQSFKSFFPSDHQKGAKVEITLRHLRLAVLSLEQRALITTETGYLGLAPTAVRQGDIVTILFGCRFPIILRPYLDDMYQVIGECYIHELMDGKFPSLEREGCVSRREFVLC